MGSGQITSGGRWVVMPPPPGASGQAPRTSAAARRRKVFSVLVLLCAGTLALGLVPALRWLLWVHLAADLALVVMVGLLIGLRAMAVPALDRSDLVPRARQDLPYVSGPAGRFEPAGHGYRLVPEPGETPVALSVSKNDRPSIKVYRPDDPPSTRLSPRPTAETERAAAMRPSSIQVAPSTVRPVQKPKMFLDDEEDFLQVQGL